MTFLSTGEEQCYAVGPGVSTVYAVAVGGRGGDAGGFEGPGGPGGFGAAISGYLPVSPGEVLYVEVGVSGSIGGDPGFGGGGGAERVNGSGGGASDVRTCQSVGVN